MGAPEHGTLHCMRRPDREQVGVQAAKTSEPLVIDNRRNDVGVGVTVHSHIIPLWKTL